MANELELWNLAFSRVGDLTIQTDAAQTITGATAANPVVVTSASHGLVSGRYVLIDGMATMTQISRRIFKIAVLTANTYQLVGEDGLDYTADITGGVAYPLEESEVVRKAALAWPVIRDEVLRMHPWNAAMKTTRLARLATAKTITGVTQASAAVITSAAHGLVNGDQFLVDGIVGMTELNGRYFAAQSVTTNTITIGEDSTTYTAYASGGTLRKAQTPLRADFGHAYRYDLPEDFLRIVDVSNGNWSSRLPWEVQGSQMRTDEGITVQIRYIYRVKDPLVFDAMLLSLLAWRLALELCETITQSNTKKADLRDLYEEAMRSAKKSDAQEASPSDFEEDSWLLARHGVDVSAV